MCAQKNLLNLTLTPLLSSSLTLMCGDSMEPMLLLEEW